MKKISLIAAFALAGSSLGAVSLEDAIKGATIYGNSYIRYVSNTGTNDGGQGYSMRFVADINSGNIANSNLSFNAGIFYQHGGTIRAGVNTDDAVNGSRVEGGYGNPALASSGLSTLWARYSFTQSKTEITGGKMRINSPISETTLDRGVGATITNNDIDGLKVTASYYDSWVSDTYYLGGIQSAQNKTTKQNTGNGMAMIGFDGEYGMSKFKVWYANIDKFMNTIFGEYSIGDNYEFKAQIAYTDMYKNAMLRESGKRVWYKFDGTDGAKSRGLYTLQFTMKPINEFATRIGYVGSFGSGYGVALNNQASFSKAGRWWYDNYGDSRNGFAFSGQGGKQDTHINIWYVAMQGKVSIVDLGLDIVGISGKNNFAVSAYKSPTGGKIAEVNAKDRTFFEITPSIDLNITKGAKISTYYAIVFGQINVQRLWTQFSYRF